MTVGQALVEGAKAFTTTSDSPALDAEVLLAEVVGQPKTWLAAHPDAALDGRQELRWQSFLARRAAGEPVAYILERQEFYGRVFRVTPDVLIPRPATELLVAAVLEDIPSSSALTIADIGTGSGAIICTLMAERPQCRGYGIDISSAALVVAQENARLLGVADRITWLTGSLLDPVPDIAAIDVIVANLPYLQPDQALHPSLTHEPSLALDGGNRGLELIIHLIRQLVDRRWRGRLAVECDPTQETTITGLISGCWPGTIIHPISDGAATRGVFVNLKIASGDTGRDS